MPVAAAVIATCDVHPQLDEENLLLLAALRERGIAVTVAPWSAPVPGGWDAYAAVIVRQTWDYSWRLPAYLDWTRAVGDRLHNAADVIAWNADKRYLFDLERAGLAVVGGELLAPGAAFVPPAGQFVVKPAVSGGARDTARYDEAGHDAARALVDRLHAAGRDVLVQPYYARVDEEAETAVVFLDGELSHCMRKGPLLTLGVPPSHEPYAAEDMSLRAGDPDVLELARRALAFTVERFGTPLYVRVDILRSDAGEPAVLELELIEPSLFLNFAPGSAAALAAAIARRAGGGA